MPGIPSSVTLAFNDTFPVTLYPAFTTLLVIVEFKNSLAFAAETSVTCLSVTSQEGDMLI